MYDPFITAALYCSSKWQIQLNMLEKFVFCFMQYLFKELYFTNFFDFSHKISISFYCFYWIILHIKYNIIIQIIDLLYLKSCFLISQLKAYFI